jgi:poly(hydroxyalkanoate) depolymerase family esterase
MPDTMPRARRLSLRRRQAPATRGAGVATLLAALAVLGSGCGGAAMTARPANVDGTTPSPGGVVSGAFKGPEGERAWRLYVPTHAAAPRTLLVLLHGCLQTAADIAAGSRMDAVAEEQGFLVLYPEQDIAANPRRCWNWFEPAHQGRDAGEPRLLAALIADVAQQHGVDPQRIHIAGISAGAGMAGLLAVAYPERFATLSLVSGVAWRVATNVGRALAVMKDGGGSAVPPPAAVIDAMGPRARAIPALVIHGDKDASLHPRNGEEAVVQWVGVHNLLRARSALPVLQESTTESRTENGYEVTEQTWPDDRGRSVVTFIRVAGLGHAWSGGSAKGSFADERGPDASRRIAALMSAHPVLR